MSSVALSEIAEINPPTPRFLADDEEVTFLPMAGVRADGGGYVSVARRYGEVAKGYTAFSAGDVLLAKITPCFENGKIAHITSLSHRAGFGSTEFHVLRPRANVDGRYLFHLLRAPRFRQDGEARMTGSAGQQRVPTRFLKDYQLPLPSEAEQRRIAAILNKADEIRVGRRQAVEHSEELVRAIFYDFFGDPVLNTREWKERRLDTIANIRSGITKGRKIDNETLRAVPYMRVANVQDGHIDLSNVKMIDASESEIMRYSLRVGDVLVTEGGDPDKLGRGAVWTGEIAGCIHQNHIFVVRLQDAGISPAYVSALLSSIRGKQYFLRSAKQTTGIASINRTQLASFPMLIPSQDVHDRWFKAHVFATSAAERMASLSAEADDLYKSLAQRAFRGKL